MKKLLLAAMAAAMMSQFGVAWAATVGPIEVTVEVDTVETLDCAINRFALGVDQGDVSVMDFGTLGRPTNEDGTPGALFSPRHFQVFCGMNTSGQPFTVTQTAGSLTSSSATLPDGAWIFTPLNGVGGDPNNSLPGSIGSQGTAAQSDALWYQSDFNGTGTTISATYGITNDPANGAFEFIPPGQAAGSYATTVTWTLTVSP